MAGQASERDQHQWAASQKCPRDAFNASHPSQGSSYHSPYLLSYVFVDRIPKLTPNELYTRMMALSIIKEREEEMTE